MNVQVQNKPIHPQSSGFSFRKLPLAAILIAMLVSFISLPAQRKAEALMANMILVEGGTFTMGCTGDEVGNCPEDAPSHDVTLSSFYISKYEVTQKQWLAIMRGKNPSHFQGNEDCPVENISWSLIQEFIQKLNRKTGETYRLPTEAEWEFAARGGILSQGYACAGNNILDNVAWYSGNSGSRTHPVGGLTPNELGLYDMSGNVMEWCSDFYAQDYYLNSPPANPAGPVKAPYAVAHGGGWDQSAADCRVFIRTQRLLHYNYVMGFRLAKSAE